MRLALGDRRLLVTLVLSVGAHVAVARAMRGLPRRADAPVARTVSIRVVSPPQLEPEPPPEPTAPPPPPPATKPVPAERARPKRAAPPAVGETPPPKSEPPPEQPPAPPSATTGTPVFGVSMESTSAVGAGPGLPVGSPGAPRGPHGPPGGSSHGPKESDQSNGAGDAPVPAYEVTAMPLPQRRCSGKYTDEAARAGIEGTVVLDVVVGADGRVRDVRVVKGLGHGLDQAAIAAMKACPFTPGRRGAEAVPVRIREFKVTFFQAEE